MKKTLILIINYSRIRIWTLLFEKN